MSAPDTLSVLPSAVKTFSGSSPRFWTFFTHVYQYLPMSPSSRRQMVRVTFFGAGSAASTGPGQHILSEQHPPMTTTAAASAAAFAHSLTFICFAFLVCLDELAWTESNAANILPQTAAFINHPVVVQENLNFADFTKLYRCVLFVNCPLFVNGHQTSF